MPPCQPPENLSGPLNTSFPPTRLKPRPLEPPCIIPLKKTFARFADNFLPEAHNGLMKTSSKATKRPCQGRGRSEPARTPPLPPPTAFVDDKGVRWFSDFPVKKTNKLRVLQCRETAHLHSEWGSFSPGNLKKRVPWIRVPADALRPRGDDLASDTSEATSGKPEPNSRSRRK